MKKISIVAGSMAYGAILVDSVPIYVLDLLATVRAGFPSPAEDLGAKRVDLTAQLVKHPQATFMLRARGDSMKEAGIRTSPFRKEPQYSKSMIVPMRRPSSDTSAIVGAALLGLRSIYAPGFRLAKAGVMLLDIQPANIEQFELGLEGEVEAPGSACSRLMAALDAVNGRWGKGSIKVGSSKVGEAPRDWSMRQERRTPAYTTEWDAMPIARS